MGLLEKLAASLVADALAQILQARIFETSRSKGTTSEGAAGLQLLRHGVHGDVLVGKMHHVRCESHVDAASGYVFRLLNFGCAVAESVGAEAILGKFNVSCNDIRHNDVFKLIS